MSYLCDKLLYIKPFVLKSIQCVSFLLKDIEYSASETNNNLTRRKGGAPVWKGRVQIKDSGLRVLMKKGHYS